MKKIIEDFILKRAERIKKKKETQTQISREDFLNKHKQAEAACEKILDKYIENIVEDLKNKEHHIKVGDHVVLNIYELDFPCYNSWDGGPSVITRCVSEKTKIKKPIIAKIKNIYIDHTLYCELKYEFFNSKFGDKLQQYLDGGTVIDMFKRYTQKRSDFPKHLGLYVSADFELVSHPQQFKIGLNIYTFLNIKSNSGKLTMHLWHKKIKATENLETAKKEYSEFELIERGLIEKHKNGKI